MIFVDVETSGLNPEINSIVSIGSLNFLNPEEQFYEECRIWEGAEVSQKALEINGFTMEEITNPNKRSLEEIISKFIKWAESAKDATFAGYNLSFDINFLVSSAERCRIKWPFGYWTYTENMRIIDVHSVSYMHHLKTGRKPPLKNKKSDLSLDKTLLYAGLPPEPKPHNALMGAKMEAEAFSRLVYGKLLLKEFEKFPIPGYLRSF